MTQTEGRGAIPFDDSNSFHDLLAARSRHHEAARRQGSGPVASRLARFRALGPRARRGQIAGLVASAAGLGVIGLALLLLWRGERPLGRPAVVSAAGVAVLASAPLVRRVARWKPSWTPTISRA